jgi:polyferredoxin
MAAMAIEKKAPLTAKLARWRLGVQTVFTVAWLGPFVGRYHSFCSPVFHCYSCPLATFACPIGVLANFSAIHTFPYVALGLLVVVGAALGSFICGWACPFGFFQDLLGKIPTRKFELPGWTGYFRYVVLVGTVLVVPYFFGEEDPLFFCRLCPAGALEAALPNTVQTAISADKIVWPTVTKTIIFLLILFAMFFTWRPWCTVFCPLGAIYGLFNKVSFVFVRFHPHECNDCDLCSKLCRYHGRSERRGSDMRCIRCLDCTRCSAVTLSTAFQTRKKPGADSELVQISQEADQKQSL